MGRLREKNGASVSWRKREAMVEGRRSWRREGKRSLERGWFSLIPGLDSKRGESV